MFLRSFSGVFDCYFHSRLNYMSVRYYGSSLELDF